MRTTLTTLFTILALAAGCSDGGTADNAAVPRIEVIHGARSIAPLDTLRLTPGQPAMLSVANTGDAPLEVRGLEVESRPPGAFALEVTPTVSAAEPHVIQPGGESLPFSLTLHPPQSGVVASATVIITSNATVNGSGTFTFELKPDEALARLVVQPQAVDFGVVAANTSETMAITLLNAGGAELQLSGFTLSGNPGYSVAMAGQSWDASSETATGITFDPPRVLGAGESMQASVTYAASGSEPGEGQLVLLSSDESAPDGTRVNLFANTRGPCINVVPPLVDFGAKLVGSQATIEVLIESCGTRDLEISDIRLDTAPGAGFSLALPASGEVPIVIAPNDAITLGVTYVPDHVAETRPDGSPVADEGVLRISSNAYLSQVDVVLLGYGTESGCPEAAITVAEGPEAIPQTLLHLSASDSVAPSGEIARYEWSVEAPRGSASIFFPSPFVENPSYEANIVGEYVFTLRVFDGTGTPSCETARYVVTVTADQAIHVELLWSTPGDVDETDTGQLGGMSVGSDVDLHFVHPRAQGCDNDDDGVPDGYFDARWDTYFANPTPDWGGGDAGADPRLDRDDKDGAGPENLNLDLPEEGISYTIGAHYWDDWGFGASTATIRVFIHGTLAFERSDVQLVHQDMWTIGELGWPGGEVTPAELSPGVPDIESSYSFSPSECLGPD